MTEQEKARQAYADGREKRQGENVQRAQDNARINGAANAAGGGAR